MLKIVESVFLVWHKNTGQHNEKYKRQKVMQLAEIVQKQMHIRHLWVNYDGHVEDGRDLYRMTWLSTNPKREYKKMNGSMMHKIELLLNEHDSVLKRY